MKNEWADLENFERVRAKIKYPVVNITVRKIIVLSSGFLHHAKKQLSGMTHVVFSFSKSNNAIVFNFIKNSETPGATKITKKLNSSVVSTVAFFNYYLPDVSKISGKYIAKLENIPGRGEAWVIYLK